MLIFHDEFLTLEMAITMRIVRVEIEGLMLLSFIDKDMPSL